MFVQVNFSDTFIAIQEKIMKLNKLLLSAAFAAISASGFSMDTVVKNPENINIRTCQQRAFTDLGEQVLSEQAASALLSEYVSSLKTSMIEGGNDYIDFLMPLPNASFIHAVGGHDYQISREVYNRINWLEKEYGTRENFKEALSELIDSISIYGKFPENATLEDLAAAKNDVEDLFMSAVDAFVDGFAPTDGKMIFSSRFMKMHPTNFGGANADANSVKECFKVALFCQCMTPKILA